MKLKKMLAAGSILVLSIIGALAAAQEVPHRLMHANGVGTLKVGQEQFKISAIVVKLIEDRKAEITIISDITIFINGTWAPSSESAGEFDIQITGGASAGGLEGAGKLNLGKDPKPELRFTLKGKSRTSKKPVEVNFVGNQT